MEEQKLNTYQKLRAINVNDQLKSKIGLKYLSWAYAWDILKTNYPDAYYTVYTNKIIKKTTRTTHDEGVEVTTSQESTVEVPYFTDEKTCWVEVGVTIEGIEYIERLPVMDNKNNAVPYTMVTMTAVNKAIQRAFVKACARHGLGLYVYAGEDLPETEKRNINYKQIATNCDRFEVPTMTATAFEKTKNEIINFIQTASASLPTDAQQSITNYVVKQTNGKRLSQCDFEHDVIIIGRIDSFIHEVQAALSAPVNE